MSLEVSNIDQYVHFKQSFIIHPRLLLNIMCMCKDLEGLGKTWKYLKGLGRNWRDLEGLRRNWKDLKGLARTWKKLKEIKRTWKDLKGLGRSWKDLKGLWRTWKDLDELERIWKNWKICKSMTDRRLELRTSVTPTQTDKVTTREACASKNKVCDS